MDVPSSPRPPSPTSAQQPSTAGRAAVPRGRPLGAPKAFAKLLAAARRPALATAGIARTLPAPARPPSTHAAPAEPKESPLGEKVAAQDARERGVRDGEGDSHGGAREDLSDRDLLDPALRHAASLAPPILPTAAAAATAAEAPLRARSLEELIPALVRRIAWAGDRHSGSVRLELGAGAYAGTTVVVHADGGRVRVEISGSEGPELDRLRTRLDSRLRGHGLDVESVA